MTEQYALEQMIRTVLETQNPVMLRDLFDPSLSHDETLRLREKVNRIKIEQCFYDLVFDWLWHTDPLVARAVRILVLWIEDRDLHIEVFSRLAQIPGLEIPFIISYDSTEKEFSVGLPGVPGWGVSHYGRDNPDIDRLLETLERVYVIAHQGEAPPYFRAS